MYFLMTPLLQPITFGILIYMSEERLAAGLGIAKHLTDLVLELLLKFFLHLIISSLSPYDPLGSNIVFLTRLSPNHEDYALT